MNRETITVDGAPEPAGPYSHAVLANGFLYVSGQGRWTRRRGPRRTPSRLVVRQTFQNVQTIFEAAGSSLEQVVKVKIYLTDLTRFARFNEV